MKVKITHTVEYEEVPEIVNKMVLECRDKLKKASMFNFNMRDLKKTSIEVEEIQSDLDLISSKLEDCLNIIIGYEEAQNPIEHLDDVSKKQENTNEDDN
jgi:predicted nucleotide-binding protein (sugar kinase/HSP70/actin superfamily)|tara:strand:+ start:152 stop:448 length:297 start_codon:yes stop_codon:yes gene_type:complete